MEKDGQRSDTGIAPRRGSRRATLLRLLPLLVVLAILAIAWSKGWHRLLTLDEVVQRRVDLQAMVDANAVQAAALFIAVYVVSVAISLPVSAALTVTAGFLFGWLPGAAAALVGATIGATLMFLVARSTFGGTLRNRLAGRFDTLASGFERDAFTYLLVLRLAPIFPFFVMNIVPALFRITLRQYVAATFLGIIPGALAYSYLGRGLDTVVEAAAASGDELSPGDLATPQIMLAFVLLGIVAVVPAVVRRLRGGRLTGTSRSRSGNP